jgi:enoyl-CoA hydratase/carnithine racemase
MSGRTDAERVTVERDGAVLRIGLARPAKRNAFDLPMIDQLAAAYARLGDDPQIRVGVLYAHGDHFSAGLDLAQVGPLVAERGPQVLAGPGPYDPFGVWAEPVPKPVVLAVHGLALTLSIELALAADIVVAPATCAFASSRSVAAWCRTAGRRSEGRSSSAGAMPCASC